VLPENDILSAVLDINLPLRPSESPESEEGEEGE